MLLLLLPAVPVPVRGVQPAVALFSGSSLMSSPVLLLSLLLHHLPLLPVISEGCGSRRSPHFLPAVREEGGGVELRLKVAWVPALGHGEIPQRPLLVAVCDARSLLLGRDVGDGSGLPWTQTVIITNAAAWRHGYRGDRCVGGDGCHGANQGG